MKVRVTLTVDVDPVAWYSTYAIRADVREHVLYQVQGSAAYDKLAITDVHLSG